MEKIYQIALTLIPGIGDVRAKKLIELYPNIEELFKESKKGLQQIFGKNNQAIQLIHNKDLLVRAEKECEFALKHAISILFYTEENFPARLKRSDCADSPVVLYYKGCADLNSSKILSIVGTRKATEYGRKLVRECIQVLSTESIMVVSGLAYGIDIEAHQASLQYELPTVAVLAHGLDRIYPGQHAGIAKQMINRGGLLTDYMSETNPDAGNFPSRNRIIAGLADATLVVEAGKKGGALITAQISNSYNRDVFAFPGDIGRASSEGCNHLIKTNKAQLVQSAEDILYSMNWDKTPKRTVQLPLFPELSGNEKDIYFLLLEKQALNFDDIVSITGLAQTKIAATLIQMELRNIVSCFPGKIYKIR